MRTALIFLLLALLLLFFLWTRLDIYMGRSTVDIHYHDTYYVIDHLQAFLLPLVFLGNFFSLGGVIGTRFRSKFFLLLFLAFIAIDGWLAWTVYNLLHS